MAKVFHWKHGWIKVDGPAPPAGHNAPKIVVVAKKDLPRTPNISVVHSPHSGKFAMTDRNTGHTVGVKMHVAEHLHTHGHQVTKVDSNRTFVSVPEHHFTEHSARAVALRFHADAQKAEPALTSEIGRHAEAHGGTQAHLQFRVKEVASLTDKLAADMREAHAAGAPITAEAAAAHLSDINRYTTLFEPADYARGAQATIDGLREKGHTLKVKNFWKGAGPDTVYRGINVQGVTPEGQKYELQFHTPDSLHAKEEVHPLYKDLLTAGEPERVKILAHMAKRSGQIPTPANAHTLA